MGEIEPWDFFYPKKVSIKSGILDELDFPFNKFYYKILHKKDLVFFVGEQQPTEGERVYAEGKKAYQMANLVLDVAQQYGCRRVYTSGAAVSFTHHELKPRVWVVTSEASITREIRSYGNTILMSDIEGKGERGSITGLNGLLLGLAKKRGFEAVCLMGEIPDYLSGVPFPYPRASRAVLQILSKILNIEIDYGPLDEMSQQVDEIIANIYEKLPSDIREKIEQRKSGLQPVLESITEEDEQWLKEHLDELFKGSKGDERPS
jgi:proteasome assembly chaperone (PAC2) family protein